MHQFASDFQSLHLQPLNTIASRQQHRRLALAKEALTAIFGIPVVILPTLS